MIIDFPTGNPPPEKGHNKVVPLSQQEVKDQNVKHPIHVQVQKVADLLHSAVQPTLKNRRLTQQRTSLPHYVETFARFLRNSVNQSRH